MSSFEGHQPTGLPLWGYQPYPIISTEDGLAIFERVSSIYNRYFNLVDPELWMKCIPGLGPPHYQTYALVPPVSQAVNYVFDILGPQKAEWLTDDYHAFITVGVLKSVIMNLSFGIVVFRSASHWPKLPPDARSYAESRAKKEDEFGQFLRNFLILANDLLSLEMDELEIQLTHATMATCYQRQSVGCGRISGMCLCSPDVVLNCVDVRDAAVYHMLKTRNLDNMNRWNIIKGTMNLAFDLVRGSRILQLPLLNQHDLVIDPMDTHLLYVLFRHDLQSELTF